MVCPIYLAALACAAFLPLTLAAAGDLTVTTLGSDLIDTNSSRPTGAGLNERLAELTAGSYGATPVDLSAQGFATLLAADETTTTPVDPAADTPPAWTQYDTIIYAHAIIGIVTWLLLAPAAVLIGRLGRKWSQWYNWHSSIQTYLTLPCTITVVGLGAYAAGPVTPPDLHHVLGFILLAVLVLQVLAGYYSHHVPHKQGTTRPWWRVAHILCGVGVLIASWVQLWTGFRVYERETNVGVYVVCGIFTVGIAITYFILVFFLALSRRKEGRPWSSALFGLGRESASPWKDTLAGQVQILELRKAGATEEEIGQGTYERRGSSKSALEGEK